MEEESDEGRIVEEEEVGEGEGEREGEWHEQGN